MKRLRYHVDEERRVVYGDVNCCEYLCGHGIGRHLDNRNAFMHGDTGYIAIATSSKYDDDPDVFRLVRAEEDSWSWRLDDWCRGDYSDWHVEVDETLSEIAGDHRSTLYVWFEPDA